MDKEAQMKVYLVTLYKEAPDYSGGRNNVYKHIVFRATYSKEAIDDVISKKIKSINRNDRFPVVSSEYDLELLDVI
jgi:hypothetical protein